MLSRRAVVKAGLATPFVFGLPGCGGARQARLVGTAMGTSYRIVLPEASIPSRVETDVKTVLAELDFVFSTWREDSLVSTINRAVAGQAISLQAPILTVLRGAEALHRETAGRFDVTCLPLLTLWGFGPNPAKRAGLPAQDEIAQALEYTGQDLIEISHESASLTKRDGRTQLDFSGIAKGYAVDRIAAGLDARGYDNFLIEFGGDLFARGKPAGQPAWRVKTPGQNTALEIQNRAVATSGPEHNFHSGVYHIIDPRNGRALPIDRPVTVIDKTCLRADARATAAAIRQAELSSNSIAPSELPL